MSDVFGEAILGDDEEVFVPEGEVFYGAAAPAVPAVVVVKDTKALVKYTVAGLMGLAVGYYARKKRLF